MGAASRLRIAGRSLALRLGLALFFIVSLAAGPGGAETLARPPYPVIFVHGLASDAGTWTSIAQVLAGQGWDFGGAPTFMPAISGVTGVSAGDFYTMNFSDHDAPIFPSQNLTLDRQGYELAAIIQAVLDANPGASKVILTAHSMGGLAAREYLQGLARANAAAPRIPYRGDVAQLIAIGTPHLGTPLASLCQSRPATLFGGVHQPHERGGGRVGPRRARARRPQRSGRNAAAGRRAL